MKAFWTISLCLVSTITLAGPKDDLIASINNLKTAITNKLNLDNANCQRRNRDSCQDALLDTVELNNVNSEIALYKLENSVRSSETRELIDDAIDKLGDVNSAVDDIQEKLDE